MDTRRVQLRDQRQPLQPAAQDEARRGLIVAVDDVEAPQPPQREEQRVEALAPGACVAAGDPRKRLAVLGSRGLEQGHLVAEARKRPGQPVDRGAGPPDRGAVVESGEQDAHTRECSRSPDLTPGPQVVVRWAHSREDSAMNRCRAVALAAALMLLPVAGCAGLPCCGGGQADVAAAPPLEPQVAWSPPSSMPPVATAPARRIVLRGVNFAFDSDGIRAADEAILDAALEALREQPAMRMQVAGHADSIGEEAYNQRLSERRAQHVRGYLIQGGIPAERLDAVGMGESSPVADNGTRDGRAQNRRVELNIEE